MEPPPPAAATGATATGGDAGASELFNRQVDLQKLAFLNGRVVHLQAENEALRERHAKREQETHEFVAYFQKEIQTRDKQITKVTEELAALKLSHALELEASQQARESEAQQLQQHHSGVEDKLTEQLFFVKEELAQLEAFRDMKDVVHAKLQALEAELARERESGKEHAAALERKFLEDKARLQKEHEKRIEIVKQQAKEDARNGLDADTRKIMTDNRRMGEELRFQLQMTEELHKEKETLEATAKRCQMELQISQAKEHEYAAAAQKQAREIRQLKANSHALEKQMSESLAELERDKFAAQHKSSKDTEELALDVDGLRRLVRLKNKELRNLRRLAQTIVDQRTDVEVFFLDALAHVRQQIDTERKRQQEAEAERYQAEMRRVRFPKLPAPAATTTAASTSAVSEAFPHFSDKLDLRQLTWEDKERVLRLVFAKINGVASHADATPQRPPSLPARRPSLNQEPATATVYFATEPSPSPPPMRGQASQSTMSLSGLAVPPSGGRHK